MLPPVLSEAFAPATNIINDNDINYWSEEYGN
jgi:hypothetical protein